MTTSSPIILYDFDGTIADSLPAMVEIYNRIAAEEGFTIIDENDLNHLRDKNMREAFREVGVPLWVLPRFIIRARREFKAFIPNIRLHDGMREAFRGIKNLGFRQGIVSSNAEENIAQFLTNNDLNIFDFLNCGGDVFGKGNMLQKLMNQYHLDQNQIIYVGDEIRDIEAARKAGVRIVSVTWGLNSKKALASLHPDAIADHPSDILRFVG